MVWPPYRWKRKYSNDIIYCVADEAHSMVSYSRKMEWKANLRDAKRLIRKRSDYSGLLVLLSSHRQNQTFISWMIRSSEQMYKSFCWYIIFRWDTYTRMQVRMIHDFDVLFEVGRRQMKIILPLKLLPLNRWEDKRILGERHLWWHPMLEFSIPVETIMH